MEILFENPFIIIVLIAALSSIVKSKKKTSENQNRRSTQPPAREATKPSSPFDEMKDIFKEVTRTLSGEEEQPVKKLEQVYRKKNHASNQGEETTYSSQNDIKKETSQIMVTKAVNEKKDKEIEIEEKTLVDAVIWAEILGPPRAKNPYKR